MKETYGRSVGVSNNSIFINDTKMSELRMLKHLDMISKPTNAHKCMRVYYTHHIPPTHTHIFFLSGW